MITESLSLTSLSRSHLLSADAEIQALLPAAPLLEYLDLSDCCVSDTTCTLLAAHSPRLEWLR